MALSVVHLSPLGSQLSFAQQSTTRIENVADWEAIAKKYRAMNGGDTEESGSTKGSDGDNASSTSDAAAHPAPAAGGGGHQMGNNVNAGGGGHANQV